MRRNRNGTFVTSVRPGRFARPDLPQSVQPAPEPGRQALLANLSNDLHRMRCLAIELQRALEHVGAGDIADDIRSKYFPGRQP